MISFQKFNTTAPTSEWIVAFISYLKDLHIDFNKIYNDLLKMSYPLWFADLEK